MVSRVEERRDWKVVDDFGATGEAIVEFFLMNVSFGATVC